MSGAVSPPAPGAADCITSLRGSSAEVAAGAAPTAVGSSAVMPAA